VKPKCIYFFRSAILVVLSLLLVGCSKNIKSNEMNQLQVGSPLSELSPKTFAINRVMKNSLFST